MEIPAQGLGPDEAYKIMVGAVIPRPIAWITSLGPDGIVNAAPFSCYTFVSNKPPIVAINVGRRKGTPKDTARNVAASGEFVLNVVPEDLVEVMHQTSADYPPDVSEPAALGLELAPSRVVRTPRLAASPINFECKLDRILDIGDLKSQLVFGEIVMFHLRDDLVANGKIDMKRFRPIARLGGPLYARLGEMVEMASAHPDATTKAPARAAR
ncbi:MAG: flavin reductase family protein [Alphaproteobacteria bacterium]|nr:flavin reductase family protein [Alphaproteobacteria bacterium]